MSKIGAYLQEHIAGEVSLSPQVREAVSRDGSPLKLKPEMVIYPKTIDDIRKVARFSWQLAERGNVLPLTVRGGGSDQTGAAIGSGIILMTTAYMNQIFEYEPKRKLVRLQPGVTTHTLSEVLKSHGATIPVLPADSLYTTVGGAIANNSSNMLSGKYGRMRDWVDQLEVVLANGEVIQTGRISKRELGRKKGLGTLEGELYRGIDNLIEDNGSLVEGLFGTATNSNVGYASIALVKGRDGSFDLSPLILGSQGTLGIVSEMILKAEYLSPRMSALVVSFDSIETARDTIEAIVKYKPAFIEYFDTDIFNQAVVNQGKRFDFLGEENPDTKAVVLVGFDDSSDRTRHKSIKKIIKAVSSIGAWSMTIEDDEVDELLSMREALLWTASADGVEFSTPSFLGGAYIPPEQFEIFRVGLKELSQKYDMTLPIYGQELSSIYYVWSALNLKKVGDKQRMLKLLDDYSKLVEKVQGDLIGTDGEGRLKSRFVFAELDEETAKLFSDIKALFDPFGILNPGVKQPTEIKQLVPMVQGDFGPSASPNYLPRI